MTFTDSNCSSYKCTKCGHVYEDRELRSKISQEARLKLFENVEGIEMKSPVENHVINPKYILPDMDPNAPDPYEVAMQVAQHQMGLPNDAFY